MNFSFKKQDKILKRHEFIKLSRLGKRLHNRYFIANFLPTRSGKIRLGITVTKRVGNAVNRNRIKRFVREYFRLNRHLLNFDLDLIIIAKNGAAKLSSEQIYSAIKNIFDRIPE